VIALFDGSWPVLRRRHVGERAEVVDEVRLIGIAMFGGGFAPVDVAHATDGAEHALQAADALVAFWCQPDGSAKATVECL